MREGVEGAGWSLSGLQKTSSTEFAGEWEGHTTRSAYLFFHRDRWPDVSIEGYLDETDRGLRGTLSLVADLRSLEEAGGAPAALDALRGLARRHLPEGYRTPLTLRLRIPDADRPADEADIEARVKLRLPSAAMEAGTGAVVALASATVASCESLLRDPVALDLLELDG